MRVFGAVLSAAVIACAVAVPAVSLTGCEYASKLRASDTAWTGSLQGQGSQVTGGSVGFAAAATPVPTPWAVASTTEQLEKGNERKVAAQVTAQARQDAIKLSYGDVAGVSCPGGVCAPTLVATPAPVIQEGRSSSGSGGGGTAWYNGFLP